MQLSLYDILLALGGQAILLAAIGWLVRSIISHGLTRDLEKYKAELHANSDREIERLRAELKLAELEHNIRFSKLHEKRADVISKIYEMMVEAEQSSQQYAYRNARNNEMAINALDKISGLRTEFGRTRLYLPESVCRTLEEFIRKYFSIVSTLKIYFAEAEYVNAELREQQNAKMLEVMQAFDSDVPAMKFTLESEFRRLLGEKYEAN
jgi:hypothetical protein